MPIHVSTENPAESPKAEQMPPHPRCLTLIVATTLDHGIGMNGQLPWPTLKGEMAYFARITKRAPASSSQGTKNAVIMGRKTWESIPPKLRPLKDRVNCVISQTLQTDNETSEPASASQSNASDLIIARTLGEGISMLDRRVEESHSRDEPSQSSLGAAGQIGNIFVIGGASIYSAVLQLPRANRILLTKIRKPSFQCDTFFPLDLESYHAKEQGWRRGTLTDLETAIGETLGETGGIKEEGDVEYEFCLYERKYGE